MDISRELYLVRDFGPVVLDRGASPLVDARVLGWLRDDGFWEGFIEFVEPDGTILLTQAETAQATLPDLARWAADLTLLYLSGALSRAERGPHVDDGDDSARTLHDGGP